MDDFEQPNVGNIAGNAARLAGGGLGIVQALIQATLAPTSCRWPCST